MYCTSGTRKQDNERGSGRQRIKAVTLCAVFLVLILASPGLAQLPDLSIDIESISGTPTSGNDITYTIYVTNQSIHSTNDALVTLILPTGCEFVAAERIHPAGLYWKVIQSGSVVVLRPVNEFDPCIIMCYSDLSCCTSYYVAAFEQGWIGLTVRINTDTPPGTSLELEARIQCIDPESDLSNNEDTMSVPVKSNLMVVKAGSGSGTLTSDPAGIDCGETCSDAFDAGTSVTLTATPDEGSCFAGWSGTDCPGIGSCNVMLDQNHTVTATFENDTDHDGASDDLEGDGPNGGDGNDDGTPDSEQANVATFRDINGSYVTLVSETGTAISSATTTTNPSAGDTPNGCSFPCGFFGFTITGLTPGQQTTMTVLLHTQDSSLNTYYKYGPTPGNALDHWYEFKYDGKTGAEITQEMNQTRIILHLTDGDDGDDDLLANGTITDVGAPGRKATSGGGSGGSGCFIDTSFPEFPVAK